MQPGGREQSGDARNWRFSSEDGAPPPGESSASEVPGYSRVKSFEELRATHVPMGTTWDDIWTHITTGRPPRRVAWVPVATARHISSQVLERGRERQWHEELNDGLKNNYYAAIGSVINASARTPVFLKRLAKHTQRNRALARFLSVTAASSWLALTIPVPFGLFFGALWLGSYGLIYRERLRYHHQIDDDRLRRAVDDPTLRTSRKLRAPMLERDLTSRIIWTSILLMLCQPGLLVDMVAKTTHDFVLRKKRRPIVANYREIDQIDQAKPQVAEVIARYKEGPIVEVADPTPAVHAYYEAWRAAQTSSQHPWQHPAGASRNPVDATPPFQRAAPGRGQQPPGPRGYDLW